MQTAASPPRWLTLLGSWKVYAGLLVANVLMTLAVVASAWHVNSGDHYTYLGYADGLLHGRYSYWYFYPDYIPDTFRNPGYPLFLAGLKGLGLGETGVRAVQVLLYGGTIALLLKLARRCELPQSWLVRSLFLLLLLPNAQLAYFSAIIFPEILTAFLLALYGVVALEWPVNTWRRTVALGLLAGLIFQVRPVFILFPVIQLALDFWRAGKWTTGGWKNAVVFLGLFGITMLPYALWNYRYHGVLKPTSLEGGAGVMQIGFWALRIPGYDEHRYWGNHMGDEVVQFVDRAQVPGYVAAFNREWDVIDSTCRPLLTARDQHYVPLMRRDHGLLFPTYSTAYTRTREKLLMQATLANIRREPGYYFKTRLYTLVRLWVTGVQRDAWAGATSTAARLKVLYPALVSGVTFLLAVLAIGWAAFGGRHRCRSTWWLSLALVIYFGLMHLPFAIQARYTVPVRPWLLLATALACTAWLTRRTATVVWQASDNEDASDVKPGNQ